MTAIPTIGDLPPAPQRGQDGALFIQRADAFIDALAAFVAQMNAFGAQLVTATQERVVDQAAGSFAGAAVARDAAIAARDAAQAYANSIDQANIVHRTGNEVVAGTKNFTGVLQLAGAPIAAAATFPEASTAEALANVASRLLSVRAAWNALVPVALADAATIALDLNTGVNFTVTVAGNRTLANPTNAKPGQEGSIFVTQGGAGNFVMSFGSSYVPDDLATYPTLNQPTGAVTELRYKIAADGKVRIFGGRPATASTLLLTDFYRDAYTSDNIASNNRIGMLFSRAATLVAVDTVVYSNGQIPSNGYNMLILRNDVEIGRVTWNGSSRYGVTTLTSTAITKNDRINFAPTTDAYPSGPSNVFFALGYI